MLATTSFSSVSWCSGLCVALLLRIVAVKALPTPTNVVHYSVFNITSTGVSLDVATAGDAGGETLLLLHGYPECSWLWRGMIDPLLSAWRSSGAKGAAGPLKLVMPDQRGYNHSSKPAAMGSYNASLLVDDAAGLIREVTLGQRDTKVHVLGHDWGGPIAWLLAHSYPQLVKTLSILNGPHPSVFIDELRHDAAQQKRSSYMLFFDTPAADLMDPATLFAHASWFDEETAAAYHAAYRIPGSRNAALNWYRANIFAGRENVKAFTPAMPSTLPANVTIAVPTLVLWGMADTAFDNEQNLLKLGQYVPQLTIKRYENVSHWVAQEVPARTAADWTDFVAGNTGIRFDVGQ